MITDAEKVLWTGETAVNWRADAIPLGQLQGGFAGLFERAAYTVQCKGYEQDDSILDRFLLCRVGDDTHVVEASFISDVGLLTRQLSRNLHSLTGNGDLATVTIVGLRVVASLDQWPQLPARR